jgi:hypothetical protein
MPAHAEPPANGNILIINSHTIKFSRSSQINPGAHPHTHATNFEYRARKRRQIELKSNKACSDDESYRRRTPILPLSMQPLEIVIDSRSNDFKFHALSRPLRGVPEFVITRPLFRFFVRLSISALYIYSLRTAVNRVLRSIAHRGGFQPARQPRNLGLWLIAACRRSPAAAARLPRCTQNLPPRQRVLRSQSKKQHVNETFCIVYLHCGFYSKQSQWFKKLFQPESKLLY